MRNIDICDPDDPNAKEWYDRYWEYRKLADRMSAGHARFFAWRYEPDTWFMAFVTLAAVCSTGEGMYWWVSSVISGAIGCYWPWAYFRQERVKRLYEKLRRKRSILRVPKFLYDAVNAEARQRGLADWDQWPVQRFRLVNDILLEESAFLRELWNDCGCEDSCAHTNRLPTRVRKEARKVLRDKAMLKLDAVSAAHRGALEGNQLRVENMQNMLEQERGTQLPPGKQDPAQGKEEE